MSTVVEELPDPATPSPMHYNFTLIPQLQSFVDVKIDPLDVIGVIIACTPSKELGTRHGHKRMQKFTLIDYQLCVVTLSLWGESVMEYGPLLENVLESFPVIICHKVQGTKISTNRGSTIVAEPETLEAKELRTWSNNSSAIIHQHIIDHDFTSRQPELRIREDNKNIRIVDAVPIGITSEVAWIKEA